MQNRERRQGSAPDSAEVRSRLNAAQQAALPLLERFGWQLRFVRRPLFQEPVPILFSADGARWVTLEPDGSVNETPGFQLRD